MGRCQFCYLSISDQINVDLFLHRIKKLTRLSDRVIRGSEPLQVRSTVF